MPRCAACRYAAVMAASSTPPTACRACRGPCCMRSRLVCSAACTTDCLTLRPSSSTPAEDFEGGALVRHTMSARRETFTKSVYATSVIGVDKCSAGACRREQTNTHAAQPNKAHRCLCRTHQLGSSWDTVQQQAQLLMWCCQFPARPHTPRLGCPANKPLTQLVMMMLPLPPPSARMPHALPQRLLPWRADTHLPSWLGRC